MPLGAGELVPERGAPRPPPHDDLSSSVNLAGRSLLDLGEKGRAPPPPPHGPTKYKLSSSRAGGGGERGREGRGGRARSRSCPPWVNQVLVGGGGGAH